jgi:hypothetical protein
MGGAVGMRDYVVRVYRNGVWIHGDGRKRHKDRFGRRYLAPREERGSGERGVLRAFSRASQRMLEFVAANVAGQFHSLLTLTYHANVERWEDDGERNHRIVLRSKRDLNRFLTCLRPELGAYLWVQEFQARGVVHYHVLCQGEPTQARVTVAWARATDALDDAAALLHAAKVERIASEHAARVYVGRYLGKVRQKVLPPGVDGAGRWWGRSRSLELALLVEVVAGEAGMPNAIAAGIRIQRCVRKYIGKVFKGRFRGGRFLDWGGELCGRLHAMIGRLLEFYGVPRRVGELIAMAEAAMELEPVVFERPPKEEVPLAQRRRADFEEQEGCGIEGVLVSGRGVW